MPNFQIGSNGDRLDVVRMINNRECQLMIESIKKGSFCRTYLEGSDARLYSEQKIDFLMPKTNVTITANSIVKDVLLNTAALRLPLSSAKLLLPSNIFNESGYQRSHILLDESYFSVLAISGRNSKVDTTVEFKWCFDPTYIRQAIHTTLEQKRVELGNAKVINFSLQCVFVNVTTKEFSDNGCRSFFILQDQYSQLNCKCDHATVFTIMLTASLKTVPYSVKVRKAYISISKRFVMNVTNL